jgi:hypothetical protein
MNNMTANLKTHQTIAAAYFVIAIAVTLYVYIRSDPNNLSDRESGVIIPQILNFPAMIIITTIDGITHHALLRLVSSTQYLLSLINFLMPALSALVIYAIGALLSRVRFGSSG